MSVGARHEEGPKPNTSLEPRSEIVVGSAGYARYSVKSIAYIY